MMRKSTYLAGAAFGLATLALAVPAQSGTLAFGGWATGPASASVKIVDSNSVKSGNQTKTYNGQAGEFQIQSATGFPFYNEPGVDLTAWCLDLLDTVNINSSYTSYVQKDANDPTAFSDTTNGGDWELGATRVADLVKFFNWNAGKVVDAASALAFQYGLWEIIYEAEGTASSVFENAGNFFAFGSEALGSVKATANSYLAALNFGESPLEQSGFEYKLVFWDSNGANQDLVSGIKVDKINAEVPLPAAGWLLGGGLLGLFGFGRIKKTAKAVA